MHLILTIWFIFAVAAAYVAGTKGRDEAAWAAIGMLFGVFALVAVAVMPSRSGNG